MHTGLSGEKLSLPLSLEGAAVAERLDCSLPTNTKRVHLRPGSLASFRKWESCLMVPLVGGFSRGSPVPLPALVFRRCSIQGRPNLTTSTFSYFAWPSRTAEYGSGRWGNEICLSIDVSTLSIPLDQSSRTPPTIAALSSPSSPLYIPAKPLVHLRAGQGTAQNLCRLRPSDSSESAVGCCAQDRAKRQSPPQIWAALNVDVLRAEWGEASVRLQGAGVTGRSLRKPADQRHRPARFPRAKIWAETPLGFEPSSPWWEASDAWLLDKGVERFSPLLTSRPSDPMRVIELWSSAGMKGREKWQNAEKTRPARFPHARIRSDPAGDRTRIALVGDEQANRSATVASHVTPVPFAAVVQLVAQAGRYICGLPVVQLVAQAGRYICGLPVVQLVAQAGRYICGLPVVQLVAQAGRYICGLPVVQLVAQAGRYICGLPVVRLVAQAGRYICGLPVVRLVAQAGRYICGLPVVRLVAQAGRYICGLPVVQLVAQAGRYICGLPVVQLVAQAAGREISIFHVRPGLRFMMAARFPEVRGRLVHAIDRGRPVCLRRFAGVGGRGGGRKKDEKRGSRMQNARGTRAEADGFGATSPSLVVEMMVKGLMVVGGGGGERTPAKTAPGTRLDSYPRRRHAIHSISGRGILTSHQNRQAVFERGTSSRPANSGGVVVTLLASHPGANRVRFPAWSLPDFRIHSVDIQTLHRQPICNAWKAIRGLPTVFFSAFENEKRGCDKGDTATCIKCPIASKRKPLNWRAVFSSHYARLCGCCPERSVIAGANGPLQQIMRYKLISELERARACQTEREREREWMRTRRARGGKKVEGMERDRLGLGRQDWYRLFMIGLPYLLVHGINRWGKQYVRREVFETVFVLEKSAGEERVRWNLLIAPCCAGVCTATFLSRALDGSAGEKTVQAPFPICLHSSDNFSPVSIFDITASYYQLV
ncbi:hypothetical protein PR048_024536 [Dryococelus australis]|uniref:Uncharacterized protein n=1 Tax=Dryococelus australis TaxID=614101 RepID=A0ABQ9GNY0_9NEOP|nr:hypothetical protein PR048_024536 [Dryococelus australis]